MVNKKQRKEDEEHIEIPPKISNQEIIKKLENENVELPDDIQAYFTQLNTDAKMNASSEIFNSKDDQLDFRTEVSEQEIAKIVSMRRNDTELAEYGIKPVYKDIIRNFERLRISKERKSRSEFVNINKSDNTDQVLSRIGDASNIKNQNNGNA